MDEFIDRFIELHKDNSLFDETFQTFCVGQLKNLYEETYDQIRVPMIEGNRKNYQKTKVIHEFIEKELSQLKEIIVSFNPSIKLANRPEFKQINSQNQTDSSFNPKQNLNSSDCLPSDQIPTSTINPSPDTVITENSSQNQNRTLLNDSHNDRKPPSSSYQDQKHSQQFSQKESSFDENPKENSIFENVMKAYKVIFQKLKIMIHTLERGFNCKEWQETLNNGTSEENIPCHYFFCILWFKVWRSIDPNIGGVYIHILADHSTTLLIIYVNGNFKIKIFFFNFNS
jgi:hypothetical protein